MQEVEINVPLVCPCEPPTAIFFLNLGRHNGSTGTMICHLHLQPRICILLLEALCVATLLSRLLKVKVALRSFCSSLRQSCCEHCGFWVWTLIIVVLFLSVESLRRRVYNAAHTLHGRLSMCVTAYICVCAHVPRL